jgi:hypothetical protein
MENGEINGLVTKEGFRSVFSSMNRGIELAGGDVQELID